MAIAQISNSADVITSNLDIDRPIADSNVWNFTTTYKKRPIAPMRGQTFRGLPIMRYARNWRFSNNYSISHLSSLIREAERFDRKHNDFRNSETPIDEICDRPNGIYDDYGF